MTEVERLHHSGRRATVGWSGTARLPAWMWVNLAAMGFATMHIVMDFGVGLFDLAGRLAAAEAALLVLIALIHVWWVLSFAAGAQGDGGGVASVAVLAAGWTLLVNGYPIVYCPVTCAEAAPLSDVAHVGSLVFGAIGSSTAVWSLWATRTRIELVMPGAAAVLVVATVVAFSGMEM